MIKVTFKDNNIDRELYFDVEPGMTLKQVMEQVKEEIIKEYPDATNIKLHIFESLLK